MTMHRVEWEHREDWITGRLVCEAEPGAPCRVYCSAGCETIPCGHDLIDAGACNAVEWINEDGAQYAYDGENGVLCRNAPVRVWWDATFETWFWEYAESEE